MAGISSFSDIIVVDVESGDPGGEPGEFATLITEVLSEWFGGATVTMEKDE